VSPLLEVRDVEVRYGNVPAVRALSLDVEEGEIVALLGANGAGKSTTLRMLSGLHRPSEGTVTFRGERIEHMPAHKIVRLGLGHVPEGRRIFPTMTVVENLEMGAFQRRGSLAADFEHVYELFPILSERRKQLGGTLSGGEQQMLAIGRALMAEPTLLLFDEPSLGLAPLIVEQIFSIISTIRDQGTTILLVEQNANQALRLSDRGYVMETGQITIEDRAAALLGDRRIREAYLGETAG
jgi:branched-chain amino acid transport system ATP-binding protein